MTASHSRIGASTCERWWNCPGSVALVAKLPPQPESPYAAEGTAAHEMAERCLREGYIFAEALVGQKAKNGYVFTPEMAEAVQVYLNTICADLGKHKMQLSDLQIEHRFHLAHIDPDCFGTNDANMPVFMDRLIIYDYKHGAGVAVDVIDNKQTLYYTVGASQFGDYDTFEMVIVQPRAMHKDGPVRRYTITRAELEAFEIELRAKVQETKKPDAPLVAGDHCKKSFCPAMGQCPALRKEVQRASQMVFSKGTATLPAPTDLTPKDLRMLLDSVPLIDAWLKSVLAYAEGCLNRGEYVDGYKLVRGRKGHRQWKDPDTVASEFELEHGPDIYEKPVLKSPAQLEKLVGKKVVEKYTFQPEGRIIMVSEDDPREAVTPEVQSVFGVIE